MEWDQPGLSDRSVTRPAMERQKPIRQPLDRDSTIPPRPLVAELPLVVGKHQEPGRLVAGDPETVAAGSVPGFDRIAGDPGCKDPPPNPVEAIVAPTNLAHLQAIGPASADGRPSAENC